MVSGSGSVPITTRRTQYHTKIPHTMHTLLPSDVIDPSLSSIGSVLTVNIEPSDDAFGRFGFTPESQSRVVVEQSGGTPVTLTVMRQGGQFGDVSVYWSVSQSGGVPGSTMDISPSEGVLEFAEGENQMNIMLVVNDDLVSLSMLLTNSGSCLRGSPWELSQLGLLIVFHVLLIQLADVATIAPVHVHVLHAAVHLFICM